MRARLPLMLIVTLSLVTAGCVDLASDLTAASDDPVDDVEDALAGVEDVLVQSHDHADVSQHGGSANMELLDYNPLVEWPSEFGKTGYGEVVAHDGLALVAVLGEPGGFFTVDVSDPSSTKVLGRYSTLGGGTYDVKFCEGTDYAVLGVQSASASTAAAGSAAEGDDAAVYGFHVVDISDPKTPEMVAFHSVPPSGSHNVHCYTGMDERVIITSTSSNFVFDPTGEVGLLASEPVFTKVEITELVESPDGEKVVLRGQYRIFLDEPASFGEQRSLNDIVYVHDMFVQEHPETGDHLLYVAHWEAGLRIVDISNPSAPQEVGHFDEKAAQYNNIHYVRPSPTTIDGRHVTVVAPELIISENSGFIRVLDTTDPANPELLSMWEAPGDVMNSEKLLFSPHNLDIDHGRMYIGHYHAGTWVVDIGNASNLASPETVAYYMPGGDEEHDLASVERYTDDAYFNEGIVPNVWGADYDGGVVYVSDISSGLYALHVQDDPAVASSS